MPDLKKMLTLEALSEALPSWLKRSTKPEYNADEIDSTLTTNQFVTASDKENWNAKGTYSKPSGGIPKSDLSSIVQTSLEKADSALQSETDPTVPSWAKQSSKPSYTQDEVADGSTYKRVSQNEKDAWSGKQNALTTTQMQAVNSGITSEGVGQISTNQTNVLYVLDKVGKNDFNFPVWSAKCEVDNGTKVITDNSIKLTATSTDCFTNPEYNVYPVDARIPVSSGETIVFSWTYTPHNSQTNDRAGIFGNGTYDTGKYITGPANVGTLEFTVPANVTYVTVRVGVATSGNSATYSNLMVSKKPAYSADPTFEPYSLPNYDLTQNKLNKCSKLLSSGSLNNIKDNEIYYASSDVTGMPSISRMWGFVRTTMYGDSTGIQEFFSVTEPIASYVRVLRQNVWQPWKQLGASCTTYSITPTAINTWTEVTRITIPANCIVKITASIGWDQDPVSGIKLTNESGTLLAINEDRSSTNLGGLTLTHIENTKGMSSGYTRVLYGEISRISGGGRTRVTVTTEYVEC